MESNTSYAGDVALITENGRDFLATQINLNSCLHSIKYVNARKQTNADNRHPAIPNSYP